MSCRDCFDIFDVKLTFALFSQKLSCDFDLLSIWAPFKMVYLPPF